MTQNIASVLSEQKQFFSDGKIRTLENRLAALDTLKRLVAENETKILEALRSDLGKPAFEGFGTEIGFMYEELKFTRARLPRWMAPRRVPTPMAHFLASSWLYPEPLGSILIISPWNYPFQLLFAPLIGALAAGNCAVLKPSELAPATSALSAELTQQYFDPKLVCCVEGGIETNQALLAEPFNHIFFTGSTAVGKIVMKAAAENLTPVTLELGGKSPCLIDDSAPLALTARRVAWGKYLNAGQTCVAPDYVLLPRGKQNEFIDALKQSLGEFFGSTPESSPDYGRIISERHWKRLTDMFADGQVAHGGEANAATRYIAPTILTDPKPNSRLMTEEVFGPLLPIIEYDDLDEAIGKVRRGTKPLSLYFFSKNKTRQKKILSELSFGGGCLNDTLVHLGNPHLPFGGVGMSGIGRYHGKYSFEAFTHLKPVLNKSTWVDIKLRYQPYANKMKLLKLIFRP